MTISYNWLLKYLPEQIPAEKLSEILTAVGLEVESMTAFEKVKGGLKGLIVGEVLTCHPHPNADKLKVTTVRVGEGQPLKIVCGAPNVAAGQKVIVAPVGTMVHPIHGEPFEIKKAKIRGEESEGMLCAEDEIGMGESHDGLLILPPQLEVGTTLRSYYQIPESDIVYEIGLTPNRMDAMSHLGVAKDVCAWMNYHHGYHGTSKVWKVRTPDVDMELPATGTTVSIQVEDPSLCLRYSGLVLENIQVKPSPEWLQMALSAIGLKPINNVVDITNYVLHECGQPLHAFDLKVIKGNTIQVKTAMEGSIFQCLDGKEIKLRSTDLMICNEEEPMCIAGVYGGLHSGVKAETQSIFLESACFQSESIRKTSTYHGLRTDAALRFEKGSDISKTRYALLRAAQLLMAEAGATVTSPMMDHYPVEIHPVEIKITPQAIQRLAGKEYSAAQISGIMRDLGFGVESYVEHLMLTVPFSKPDVSMVADVVEEVMRIDGLDHIPFTGKISYSLPIQKGYIPEVKKQLASRLVSKGFYEIFTNSITNAHYYPERGDLVRMMNSLSANLDIMRPETLESGLEAIAYNLNRKNSQIKFYEFGKVYREENSNYIEEEKLSLYFCGNYHPPYYRNENMKMDLVYVKGIIAGILPSMDLQFDASEKGADIKFRNKSIGSIQRVSSEKRKMFDIKEEVWYAVLNWNDIQTYLQTYTSRYTEIPKFPGVERDLSIVVSKSITYRDIETTVKKAKCKLLKKMNLFDIFEHEKLGKENRSYALNFSFADPSKTLTDEEIESEMKKITEALSSQLGAQVRDK